MKVTENWRKLHNEQLHNLYPTTNVIREIKSWIRIDKARMGKRNAEMLHSLCWENLKQRLLGRPGNSWEDIKMDLKERVWRVKSGFN